ncbi:PREDICTED: uncharacterized protein LOC104806006 [Tarenaya hassleriana]|uniref:uncharacterized protein LOC104806006 n=1 Tax=Tarenaya hassleriana TaxID=28532 RepID=UPI00053C6FF5|nr:PREDICTED: uncharacterized protein LOC104806006 [Tarenaya hassleriana]
MSSQFIEENRNRQRNVMKRTKKKWVGSAVSAFFGSKKQESSSNGLSERSRSKGISVKVSKTKTFLSKLFRKGKMRRFSEKGRSELGQGQSFINRGGAGESEPSDDDDDDELCKRRILMGGKCKPLQLSGLLNPSDNGFLFHEK